MEQLSLIQIASGIQVGLTNSQTWTRRCGAAMESSLDGFPS